MDISIAKSKIIIIDDNSDHLSSMTRILKSKGLDDIHSFEDGVEGLQEVLKGDSDLLMLDINMPGINGIEILIELKKAGILTADYPVLIVTGETDPSLQDTAFALGTLEYLMKPFRPSEVYLRVKNLLRIRQLYNQTHRHSIELETKVHARTLDLYNAHLDTVNTLARAAEFRDDDTGKHILRVGETARMIAKWMNFDIEFQDEIKYAAQLHDLGKIGIKDSILLKKGSLTKEEFEHVKTHTTIGHGILSESTSDLLKFAAEISISHHERWNGEGYPHGLAGNDIPISGRITAVADVFDALTHERPYKKAWTREDALNEIRDQKSKMFDPQVVEAFINIQAIDGAY